MASSSSSAVGGVSGAPGRRPLRVVQRHVDRGVGGCGFDGERCRGPPGRACCRGWPGRRSAPRPGRGAPGAAADGPAGCRFDELPLQAPSGRFWLSSSTTGSRSWARGRHVVRVLLRRGRGRRRGSRPGARARPAAAPPARSAARPAGPGVVVLGRQVGHRGGGLARGWAPRPRGRARAAGRPSATRTGSAWPSEGHLATGTRGSMIFLDRGRQSGRVDHQLQLHGGRTRTGWVVRRRCARAPAPITQVRPARPRTVASAITPSTSSATPSGHDGPAGHAQPEHRHEGGDGAQHRCRSVCVPARSSSSRHSPQWTSQEVQGQARPATAGQGETQPPRRRRDRVATLTVPSRPV